MPNNSILDLTAALSGRDFERLVGMREGQELDFKKEPYLLESAKGKWELAKDVAAFANAGGGCIVIGPRTEQRQHDALEVVVSVAEVPKDRASIPRYRDVLAEWLMPTPKGIELRWYPEDSTTPRGLLLIRVPAAPEYERPVLLRRLVEDSGNVVQAFAWPVRNHDRTDWEPVERVQHILASSRLSQRALLEPTLRAAVQDQAANSESRALELRRMAGWMDDPCIILQAQPPAGTDLLAHLHGVGGIQERVRRWEGIRRMGFDLETRSEPEVVDGGVLFGGGRWKARVAIDGWVELVLPVAPEFLCWAMRLHDDADASSSLRVNSVPLVEVTYDFHRLLRDVVASHALTGRWQGWLRAIGLKSAGVLMHRGRPDRQDWFRPERASADSWMRSYELTLEPERDAFEALRQLYGLFGIAADAIPFSSHGRVVPSKLIELRG